MKIYIYVLYIVFIYSASTYGFSADTCTEDAAQKDKNAISNLMQIINSESQVQAGEILKTGPNEKREIHFLTPFEHKIFIEENSEIIISKLPTATCGVQIFLQKGKVTSSGEHKFINDISPCVDQSEIETENVSITPTGTKYSVDLNDAIAESRGETVNTKMEKYFVESGGITVKLKKIKPNARSQRIAKNGKFKVKAGKKAIVKVSRKANKKIKVADIEVLEP